jgi:O-antigen/teichoic acid export membrane protein
VAIGRWLGASLLGQYTVANNLVKVPADHLVRNLQTVLFPLAARAQDNDAGLRRAYLTVLAGVGVVSFPLFTFVALMAEPIVLMLLGTHWTEAAVVLVPLSVAMIGHAIEALCGPILSGRGEPGAELRVKTATLIVMLLVLAFTATWSLSAVGWGVAGVYILRWLWMNATVMKRLQISLRAIGAALLGPSILSALCLVAVRLVEAAFAAVPQAASPAAHVVAASVVGVALIGSAVVGAPGVVLGQHLLALVDRLARQRPGFVRIPGFRRIAAFAARSSA